MEIRIRCKKIEAQIAIVKDIEEIKCNTKLLEFLLKNYEESIKKEVTTNKKSQSK